LTLAFNELNEINTSLKDNLAENKKNQLYLEKVLAKQQALFDASTEAVFSFNNNEIENINQAAIEFLGLTPDDIKENKKLSYDLFLNRLSNKQQFLSDTVETKENERTTLHGFFEAINGNYYEFYSVPEITEGHYIGRMWCCRDITNIRKNEALLLYRANHDALTELPNRAMILEELNHAIKLSKRHNSKIGLLFIDLDDFKKINDTAGHQEGDRYLIEFANRLQSVLKSGDILGRLGGDEFVVILEDIKNIAHIIQINQRILKLCEVPFYIKDKKYHISCSIGVSISPDDAINSDELIRKADMAMYQAKKLGKNIYHLFDNKLEKVALEKVNIESQLRDAIVNDDFILHFQPKISLNNNSLHSVEALIRWQKTAQELVYPDSFINIAEENGLIKSITYWVINKACKTLKHWQGTVLENIPLSLNITALDFSDKHFVDQVFKIIDKNAINPALIELELTESIFLNDISSVKKTIAKLKSRNIKLSIDDFGTGFSSFAYLRDLDIDFLKIDKSFVFGVHKDPKSRAIVKSIIDIGSNLGMKVIAEGIESENEMAILTEEGCHIGQGYYMSKPVSDELLMQYATKLNIINSKKGN
ncbi:putative bifunctional diguanylate cyclase/phosphodiesterase, partial [Psychromonas antarctica]|uniref:putative bifunctional diguanylate cyclase/phosphodiesterase n=1 Tax=Psychromonas antarctica TaxID=67573 RepID=UPI001EE7DA69